MKSEEAWLKKWYETHQLDDLRPTSRYITCRFLEESSIPCVLWHEDALQYYDVKTGVFDIFILVPDVPKATEALIHRGNSLLPPRTFLHNPRTSETMKISQRLKIPNGNYEKPDYNIEPPDVVLLPATEWDFIFSKTSGAFPARPSFIPHLPDLVDILIDKWLDNSDLEGSFRMHLTVCLSYLYAYVPIFKSPNFAQLLNLEHRQYHADALSGMTMYSEPCRDHQREIRSLIHAGKYKLKECSTSKDNEALFTSAAHARLLAKMPRVEPDPMLGAHKTDSNALVREAAISVGIALATITYAIVGGAACVLLGSIRVTQDIDVVVPKGMTQEARSRFRNSEDFSVEPKTAHTFHKNKVEIEILTPPIMFQEKFDSSTPVVQIEGANVLKPTMILNAKSKSFLGRVSEDKKASDATDIMFLLDYLASNNSKPTPAEVPNISREFVQYFIGQVKNEEKWIQAGYDLEAGTF